VDPWKCSESLHSHVVPRVAAAAPAAWCAAVRGTAARPSSVAPAATSDTSGTARATSASGAPRTHPASSASSALPSVSVERAPRARSFCRHSRPGSGSGAGSSGNPVVSRLMWARRSAPASLVFLPLPPGEGRGEGARARRAGEGARFAPHWEGGAVRARRSPAPLRPRCHAERAQRAKHPTAPGALSPTGVRFDGILRALRALRMTPKGGRKGRPYFVLGLPT